MDYTLEYCNPFDGSNDNIWMKMEHAGRYLFARRLLEEKKAKKVLDIACADGYGTELLKEKIPHVIGVDRNISYLPNNDRKTYFQVDLNEEKPEKYFKNFDAVVSFETIEHLDLDPSEFLASLYKILKKGGLLILSFPNAAFEKIDENGNNYDPFHKHIFQKDDIFNLVTKTGFKIKNILGQSFPNLAYKRLRELDETRELEHRVDKAFNYDRDSISALATLFAMPNNEEIDQSYSYIVVAEK